VKFILGLACAFKAHSSCILLAMALVVGPLARGISLIPLCVSTLRLIFHSWKCDVYQFPFHLLLCFHFLVLNNFSTFLLVSIQTMIDQSDESNPMDPHHLVFRAWLSRFGIGKEVYYTKCLTKGHPCL